MTLFARGSRYFLLIALYPVRAFVQILHWLMADIARCIFSPRLMRRALAAIIVATVAPHCWFHAVQKSLKTSIDSISPVIWLFLVTTWFHHRDRHLWKVIPSEVITSGSHKGGLAQRKAPVARSKTSKTMLVTDWSIDYLTEQIFATALKTPNLQDAPNMRNNRINQSLPLPNTLLILDSQTTPKSMNPPGCTSLFLGIKYGQEDYFLARASFLAILHTLALGRDSRPFSSPAGVRAPPEYYSLRLNSGWNTNQPEIWK